MDTSIIGAESRAEEAAAARPADSDCSVWSSYSPVMDNNPGHSMPSQVWAEALEQMEASGSLSNSELLSLYGRALASCPYSARIWCQLIAYQRRAGEPREAAMNTLEAALNSGLHRAEDLDAVREAFDSAWQ